jgi:vanillate O-demethylase monooxygenase subunit
MIEPVQRMMGCKSFDEMNPVLLSIDAGASRPRRVLRELIERERLLRGGRAAR